MENNKVKHHSRHRSGFVFGVLLVLAGIVFLGFNFGWLNSDFRRVIFSWQMLLVVLGIISMCHRHIFSGLVLLVTGTFFIMPRLAQAMPDAFYWVDVDNFTSTYWPVLLIIGGIFIVLQWIFPPKWKKVNHYTNAAHKDYEYYHLNRLNSLNPAFERNSIFSNIEEIILEPEFKGGEVNAIFGGVTLDLRKTALPEGETVLEMNAIFGGVNIFVPKEWNVELHLSSIFGGFDDKRSKDEDAVDRSRKLIVVGSCIFGGGEISN